MLNRTFESLKQVKQYLSASRLKCLVCGKGFKGLNVHVLRTHHMTADDYKQKFGIPVTYGLVCAPTLQRLSAAMKEREAQLEPQEKISARGVATQGVKSGPKRPPNEVVRQHWRVRAVKVLAPISKTLGTYIHDYRAP